MLCPWDLWNVLGGNPTKRLHFVTVEDGRPSQTPYGALTAEKRHRQRPSRLLPSARKCAIGGVQEAWRASPVDGGI